MIVYTTAQTNEELKGLLALQRRNHADKLTAAEIKSQGFVTVRHQLTDLQQMNAIEQNVIAKDGTQVIAYAIAMTAASQNQIPILVPMFELFRRINYQNKPVSGYRYMVVGQVCVDKDYRGRGVFDALYAEYKRQFANRYDFAITEIVCSNERSLNAHKRVGFEEIHRYTAPDGEQWSIVVWNWRV
jgi:GNAT superfamily N-acetyltransferase